MSAPRFLIPSGRRAARALAPLLLVLLAAGFRAGGEQRSESALGGIVRADSHRPPAAVQGIPEYPGARRTQGSADGDGADVVLRLPFMTVRMEAVRYTSSDPMDRVLRYYQRELATYGEVKVTEGGPNTHIEDFRWDSEPDHRTLSVEHEDRVHMVAIKPVASGCEFALMYMSFK